MKNRIILLLLIALLISACAKEDKPSDVNFYYPKAEFDYNTDDGAISYEVRSNGGIASSAILLNLYLQGPLEEGLLNPFPENVSVVSLYTLEDTVYVTLSDSMAELSGAPLILSCACICRTAMGLAGTQSAQIQCETLLLDGKKFITVNENTVFYSDIFHQAKSEVP